MNHYKGQDQGHISNGKISQTVKAMVNITIAVKYVTAR